MLSRLRVALRAKEASLMLVCLLSIALGFSIAANIYHRPASVAIAADTGKTASNWRTAFEEIATKFEPSVVQINSEKTVTSRGMFPGSDDFFAPFGGSPFGRQPDGESPKRTQKASGSGVIVRSDGYILTNSHVVADMDRVTVQLSNGKKYDGKVFLDKLTDLALVKIDATNLPAAQLADSDDVKVGQWAIAIGNPFGLRNTVTVGVVSAFRRSGEDASVGNVATEVIQTDASINPGNSGGPLVDIEGRVVGINFMIYSESGGNQGIGFAIPSNTAKFVMNQLIDKGRVVRGYLGIDFGDVTPGLSDKLGAKFGALVTNVYKDSPAGKAGIQVKDVITKVEDTAIKNGFDLRRAIQSTAPGTNVKVTVIRDKKEKTISVKLVELKGDKNADSEDQSEDKIGMSVQPLTPELAKDLGIDEDIQGVIVRKVQPGSAAERAEIKPRDIITEIDNAAITSVATFSKATKSLKAGDTAIVVIQRGERSMIVEMPID